MALAVLIFSEGFATAFAQKFKGMENCHQKELRLDFFFFKSHPLVKSFLHFDRFKAVISE